MDFSSLFEGERIDWQALDPEKDSVDISAWTLNPLTSRSLFEDHGRPYPVFEVKKKLKEVLKKADEKKNIWYFGIHLKEGSTLCALVRFDFMMFTHQAARLMIDLAEDDSLDNYGAELMRMTLRYAFMELSLHRVWSEIPASKTSLIDLYEKNGFIRETQRREAFFADGKYEDLMVYSLLKPEWKQSQTKEVVA